MQFCGSSAHTALGNGYFAKVSRLNTRLGVQFAAHVFGISESASTFAGDTSTVAGFGRSFESAYEGHV